MVKNLIKSEDLPHVMTAKNIQEYLNISISKAYELFKESDFPVINIGGSKRVFKDDFLQWIEQRKNA